jgi:hypothetical protein
VPDTCGSQCAREKKYALGSVIRGDEAEPLGAVEEQDFSSVLHILPFVGLSAGF